jgi:hypothetical protein
VVTASTNAAALVNTLVAGASGISIVAGSQTLINPGANANGTFTGGDGIIPFNSGILLTSGSIANVVGPNNSSAATLSHSAAGDAALTTLAGAATFDASVLQFDFIPTGNVISFQFVFGSEEYNEFVGSQFNDVFAFFLNGANIALIPGTPTPITINNVNNGSNAAFYRDNTVAPQLNTQLDGLVGVSIPMFATASVNAGQVNRIRIAIADTSDTVLDSAVFLAGGSFIDQPPPGIPEPGTFLLIGSGFIGIALARRFRRGSR